MRIHRRLCRRATVISRRPPPPLEAFLDRDQPLWSVAAFLWPPDYYPHYAAFLEPFLVCAVALPGCEARLAARDAERWLPSDSRPWMPRGARRRSCGTREPGSRRSSRRSGGPRSCSCRAAWFSWRWRRWSSTSVTSRSGAQFASWDGTVVRRAGAALVPGPRRQRADDAWVLPPLSARCQEGRRRDRPPRYHAAVRRADQSGGRHRLGSGGPRRDGARPAAGDGVVGSPGRVAARP